MNTTFKIFLPLLIISALLTFAACAGDTYDNAALNISINNDRVRAAALDISLEEINHQIVLTGPTGTVLTYNITGAGNVSTSVTAGTWRIDVTGYYGEELYSQGTASVAVKAGQSNSVSVLMNVVWQEGGFFPPGSDLPQLPGFTWIEGNNYFKTAHYTGSISINVHYYDSAWESADRNVTISPMDGYIVQWYVGGQLVQTDTDVSVSPGAFKRELDGSVFDSIEEYWNRDVFAIVSHPDYYGVKSNSLRICKPIDPLSTTPNDWLDSFMFSGGRNGFEWEGNSFFLLPGAIASLSAPLGSFADAFNGYLDGNGETITLAMSPFPGEYGGLFAHIGPRGTVMNLQIYGGFSHSPSSDCYVGAVAGLNEGTIMNIAYNDPFSGSLTAGSTSGNNYAGGITGNNKGIIKNCYVNLTWGYINADPTLSYSAAGGIAGVNEGEINFCWVKVGPPNQILGNDSAGGIAGKNEKTISHCVALVGQIVQQNGTNCAGRIWGTGNGTGSANWANNDNGGGGRLELSHNPGTIEYITVDPAEDRTDSKHGKGVFYDYTGGPIFSSDDASLDTWWMYTAGWDAVWYPLDPLASSTNPAVFVEKRFIWVTKITPTPPTPPPFMPLLQF